MISLCIVTEEVVVDDDGGNDDGNDDGGVIGATIICSFTVAVLSKFCGFVATTDDNDVSPTSSSSRVQSSGDVLSSNNADEVADMGVTTLLVVEEGPSSFTFSRLPLSLSLLLIFIMFTTIVNYRLVTATKTTVITALYTVPVLL